MPTDTDELFRDRTVRSWIAVQVMAVLAWLATIGVLSLNGLAHGSSSRSWCWSHLESRTCSTQGGRGGGTGPMAVMSDPAALRRYRRTMILSVVGGVGVLFVVVTLVVATGMVVPMNT